MIELSTSPDVRRDSWTGDGDPAPDLSSLIRPDLAEVRTRRQFVRAVDAVAAAPAVGFSRLASLAARVSLFNGSRDRKPVPRGRHPRPQPVADALLAVGLGDQ